MRSNCQGVLRDTRDSGIDVTWGRHYYLIAFGSSQFLHQTYNSTSLLRGWGIKIISYSLLANHSTPYQAVYRKRNYNSDQSCEDPSFCEPVVVFGVSSASEPAVSFEGPDFDPYFGRRFPHGLDRFGRLSVAAPGSDV